MTRKKACGEQEGRGMREIFGFFTGFYVDFRNVFSTY